MVTRVSDFFDPFNAVHVKSYWVYKQTGFHTEEFNNLCLRHNVFEDPLWDIVAERKMVAAWIFSHTNEEELDEQRKNNL